MIGKRERGGKRHVSMVKRPQIGDCAFSFPMRKKKKKEDLKTNKKHNPYKGTGYTRYLESTESRSDPYQSENLHEIEQIYDELERDLTGEHEVAAHGESEMLERKHATTTAAAHEESEILERQHMTTTAETLERYTKTTAATKDVTDILEQKHAVTKRQQYLRTPQLLLQHAKKKRSTPKTKSS